MAKSRKLKVFRTAIGFHDAYIAAPSMKAALEAWGASRNLFASGAAEPVTDDTLAAPALAQPGVVLKVLRGTPAEQIAALGEVEADDAKPRAPQRPVAVKRKEIPRPSRADFDQAEAALDALTASQRQAEDELARDEAALKKRRAALQKSQDRERSAAEEARDREQAAYDRALAKWQES